MKKHKVKSQILDELRKIPIIQVACEKCGISRNSFYKWKHADKKFEKEIEEAMNEGVAFVNDMSESQLLTLIKEKNWQAISFWLKSHHANYKTKVEITTIKRQEELTPEQEAVVKEALRLGTQINNDNNNQNE
jgi:hypothetical protein